VGFDSQSVRHFKNAPLIILAILSMKNIKYFIIAIAVVDGAFGLHKLRM
jgi:hypothetical protein